MIRRLYIENFFLIRDLEIEFEEGLNVISGETGTGKSMTVSSIEFVKGKQGDYPEGSAVEIEIETEEDTYILRREVKGGRSRYFLNGRGTNSKTVKEIIEKHVYIQGQHEFIKLMKQDFQRELLDNFAKLKETLKNYQKLYDEYTELRKTLEEIENREREILERKDYLEFRLKEIEDTGISLEEYKEIKEKEKLLKNLEARKKAVEEAVYFLYDGEGSAYERLYSAEKALSRTAEDDLINRIRRLREEIAEITETLRNSSIDVSEEEIDRINEIIFRVQRLERKYRKSYEEILKEAEYIREELVKLENLITNKEDLVEKLKEKEKEIKKLADKISEVRKREGKKLEKRIEGVLKELNLDRARFKVLIEEGEISRYGKDRIKFLFSSYGEDLKPVSEIASGGEMSRIFLALSLILPPVDTFVFDEVDTGISGETSLKLAKFLKELSKKMQIIVVTHSAPICAAGDVNFVTEKEFIGDIPYIRVRKLTDEEKVKEVARLMGARTETTIKGAKELISMF